jgi:hypothetical protein
VAVAIFDKPYQALISQRCSSSVHHISGAIAVDDHTWGFSLGRDTTGGSMAIPRA